MNDKFLKNKIESVECKLCAVDEQLQVIANVLGASSGITDASLLTELQLKADLTETQPVSLVQSRLAKLEQEANDLSKLFAYADVGTVDERVITITYSGTTTPTTANVIKTFTYTGGPGTYLLSTITLS